MIAKQYLFCLSLLTLLLSLSAANGAELLIDDFSKGLSPHWKEKSFKGNTIYSIISEEGTPCLQAMSIDSASGLVYETEIDLQATPILSWKWKIDHVLKTGDAKTRKGDDYAARIYIVFPSAFFWQLKALNYIWANKLPKGEILPSLYAENSIMIAAQQGNTLADQWITERHNVYEDYIQAFGTPPPKTKAVAIMTDTDGTGETTTAWYGPLRFLSQ